MNLELGTKVYSIVVPYIVSYRSHNIVKHCVFVHGSLWDAPTILSLLALGWGIPWLCS